jgi:hypothetical protein
MRRRSTRARERRNGAAALECAVALPILLFLLFAIILGGMACHLSQQCTMLAHEIARKASVRGDEYQRVFDLDSPSAQKITDEVALEFGVNIDLNFDIRIELVSGADGSASDWDAGAKEVLSINAKGVHVANNVRVMVTRIWTPPVWMAPITLTSVAIVPMSS